MTPTPREVAAELVDRVLDVPGHRAAPTAMSWLCSVLDADRVEVHMLDRRRERLHLAAAAVRDATQAPAEPHLDARTSPAAQALHAGVVLGHRVNERDVHHVPLEAYGHTVGVLSIVRPATPLASDVAAGAFGSVDWRRLGRTLAVLFQQAATTTDALELARRTYEYSIAAELQWDLLPPADTATDRFALRALVEPAPRVTSDLFDWSLNGDRLTVVLLDAAGRGLVATQVGDLALAALRNARRSGLSIAEQAALADQALWDRHHGHAAVDVVLLEIDLVAGTATAVHAGSPIALRRRDHEVELLDLGNGHEPLGLLDRTRYDAGPVDLRPGDVLMLLSDGVAAARDSVGRVFGVDVLAHRLERSSAPRDLPSWLVAELRSRGGR
ncbi:PP2C family protein-serine/threonine phosphatase [Actinomycetospora chibensis]|uniref:PP2C family protein-serine/threonine phosphatase n=1 Tax=Actinomycetospora chibensis TaxID=663606 RepID=A0ABV9RNS3_9PSEU|nr:PP2C family protein-serine/threonine phosphatase [Actinomycetospora chibensis]MDD7923257.1 PP2C family protein-serine/threonine phosphatase [Actinomycetospora chibensis]